MIALLKVVASPFGDAILVICAEKFFLKIVYAVKILFLPKILKFAQRGVS